MQGVPEGCAEVNTPPPIPDVRFNETMDDGIGPKCAAVIAVLLVLFIAVCAWMVAHGCDPLRCR